MAVIVLAVAALALFVPKSCLWIPSGSVNYLLMVVMFGMGLTMKPADFAVVFSRPKDIIIGCAAQFVIMPLLAFGLGKLFGLENELLVGVVLVGTCPGGTSSNVITYLSGGDVALSVGMTSVNTLLAPLLTPALTYLFLQTSVDVDVWAMFLSGADTAGTADKQAVRQIHRKSKGRTACYLGGGYLHHRCDSCIQQLGKDTFDGCGHFRSGDTAQSARLSVRIPYRHAFQVRPEKKKSRLGGDRHAELGTCNIACGQRIPRYVDGGCAGCDILGMAQHFGCDTCVGFQKNGRRQAGCGKGGYKVNRIKRQLQEQKTVPIS